MSVATPTSKSRAAEPPLLLVVLCCVVFALLAHTGRAQRMRAAEIGPLVTAAGSDSSSRGNRVDGYGIFVDFDEPGACVVSDDDSELYFVERGSDTLRMYIMDTRQVVTIAGGGTSGGGDEVVNGEGTVAVFSTPTDLAFSVDRFTLYVCELSGHRIRAVDMTTTQYMVSTYAGSTYGLTDGAGDRIQFQGPIGIGVLARDSTMFIAEHNANRIRRVLSESLISSTLAGSSSGFSGTNDGYRSLARFDFPTALTIDQGSSNIYVVDGLGSRVRVVTIVGFVTTVAGSIFSASADGTGTNARFDGILGIAVRSRGEYLYVTEANQNRIRQIATMTFVTRTVAGLDGEAGWKLSPTQSSSSTVNHTSGICLGNYSMWITANYRIITNTSVPDILYTPAPTTTTLAPTPAPTEAPFGNGTYAPPPSTIPIVVDPEDIEGLAVVAGNTSRTELLGSIDGVGLDATVTAPGGCVVNGIFSLERVYFVEAQTHTLRSLAPATQDVRTLAGVRGNAGVADGLRTDARFNGPADIAISGDGGTLFIADEFSHRIRRVTTSLFNVRTFAGSTFGYGEGIGVGAKFGNPCGIDVSPATADIVVVERSGHRVRTVTPTLGRTSTRAGSTNGTIGYHDDPDSTLARFEQPNAVAVAANGNIYVSDQEGSVVRRIAYDIGSWDFQFGFQASGDGEVTSVAGNPDDERGVSSDGIGGNVTFQRITALAVSGTSLFIADGNRVRRLALDTNRVYTVINVDGTPAWIGNTVSTMVNVNGTSGLCFSNTNVLWVSGAHALASNTSWVEPPTTPAPNTTAPVNTTDAPTLPVVTLPAGTSPPITTPTPPTTTTLPPTTTAAPTPVPTIIVSLPAKLTRPIERNELPSVTDLTRPPDFDAGGSPSRRNPDDDASSDGSSQRRHGSSDLITKEPLPTSTTVPKKNRQDSSSLGDPSAEGGTFTKGPTTVPARDSSRRQVLDGSSSSSATAIISSSAAALAALAVLLL